MSVLERMVSAVEKVRERLVRACGALEAAGVRYAVIGGNAVAAWVATVDEAAVRNTQDVDILVEPQDFATAREALEAAGFVYRHAAGVDAFLDGPQAKLRDAVHIVLAGRKVRPEYLSPAPDATRTVPLGDGLRVLALDDLIRMKLTSFRRKDQVHLLDLIEVGLVGEKDLAALPPELAARLRELIESPDT
ncbi:MAG: nucleotidyltransferase family protein [Planctomycetes bacterium]|nr:nucleotidyltransferase family protein [Planctomycetota bacterium]